jgi:hypothetical protein
MHDFLNQKQDTGLGYMYNVNTCTFILYMYQWQCTCSLQIVWIFKPSEWYNILRAIF